MSRADVLSTFVRLVAILQLKDMDVVDESVRCICHKLHCLVTKALESPSCEALLEKCRNIVKTIKNSSLMLDAFRAHQKESLQELLEEREKRNFAVEDDDDELRSCRLKLILEVSCHAAVLD